MMSSPQTQVDQSHYKGLQYDTPERWSSYHYQIVRILSGAPSSVLEIGVGSGVLRHYLKEVAGIQYSSVDLDQALQPTYCGDLLKLDSFVPESRFDCVCAFQVLEHLPFEMFDQAVEQMRRAAQRRVVISLPNNGFPIEVAFRFLRQPWHAGFFAKIPRFKKFQFDGQHYWELGVAGHPRGRILAALNRQFKRVNATVCPGNSYHVFFECEK